MTMTRQHFQLIADILKQYNQAALSGVQPQQVNYVALMREITFKFSNELKETNSQFDVQRFVTACGIDDGITGINWTDGTSTIRTRDGIKTVPSDTLKIKATR